MEKTIQQLAEDISRACYEADLATLQALLALEVARVWLPVRRGVRK